MQLKIQNVMDATLLISQIIRDQRPMPQIGKYHMARMHAKFLPEFVTINAARDAMITAYQCHQTLEDGTETAEWMVPPDKVDEFNAAWLEIAGREISIDVEPLTLADVDLGPGVNGVIEASEFIVLGDLFAG